MDMTLEELGFGIPEEGIPDEKHGPLTGFTYALTSHGMMMGSGSSRTRELEWKQDGTVELEDRYSGGGTRTVERYAVSPETARKIPDLVNGKKLAALSQMDIRLPLVYDCFTSATIGMTFDDRPVGGAPYVRRSLYCGAAGMVFGPIEDEIRGILEELEETGELLFSEEKKTEGGLPGFMGPGGSLLLTPGTGTPEATPPAGSAPPEAEWNFGCGKTGNTGKFCPECGSPRPQEETGGWTCSSCGTAGNLGKFCSECGSRKPAD